MLNMTVRLSVI